MNNLKNLRGTVDLLPDQLIKWQNVEKILLEQLARASIKEIRTPILEMTELFIRGIGEGTDVVSKEMYTFLDRGERSCTLRPEGTASVARALIQNGMSSNPLQKLWYMGPMFRYERPQAGRQRQFHQLGVEFIGYDSVRSDVEIIALAWDILCKLGIKEIFSMGGAQAIASLEFIQIVNKVVGPGNKYVAEAKRQLSGKIIGTETMYAGASEICVLADKDSDISQVATSLVSQAEHDPDSQCILVTKDKNLIKKTLIEVKKILSDLPRKIIASRSLKKNGLFVLVKNDKQIIEIINEIAPEHLELNVKNFKKYENKIKNAGSICNGPNTPMSASDYTVGTNHVLPTFGSSKFSSGLNLNEFTKKISIVTLSKLGVEKIGNPAITLSEFEQLLGHTQSIKSRIRRN